MGKFALMTLMFAFAISNKTVLGANDCTPPWMVETNPFFAKVKSEIMYRCPQIFGDQRNEYCCYSSDGEVECCNYKEYLIFRIICFVPVFIIAFIILSIISSLFCFMCPCCIIYKRRRIGW